MSASKGKSKADLEWERRVLCSDEACIGTIGSDGKCRECGRPYEGDLPESFGEAAVEDAAATSVPDSDADMAETRDDADGDEVEEEDDAEAGDDEWENRTLCSDESCIGVIGPDGRCKECGKPFEG